MIFAIGYAIQRWAEKQAAPKRIASEQSRLLRCGIDTLPKVDLAVNYSAKLCFILNGRLVTRRAAFICDRLKPVRKKIRRTVLNR
jgi:hypothetical protein